MVDVGATAINTSRPGPGPELERWSQILRLGEAPIRGRTVLGIGSRHLLISSRVRPVIEHLVRDGATVDREATAISLRKILPLQDAAVLTEQLMGYRQADSRFEVVWRNWWRGFVNIPLWRPSQGLVTRLQGRVLTPNRLSVWAVACLLAVLSVPVGSLPAVRPLGFSQWAVVWALVTATTLVHELGHFFVAAHYGVRSRSIGVALFYVQPAAYTDVTNSWLVRKQARIAIALGGLLFQSFLLLAGYTAWRITSMSLLGWYCLLSLGWMAFNLMPFVRLDGYWVLSFALDEPNLRQRAFGQLIHWFVPARVPTVWNGAEAWMATLFAVLSALFTLGLYLSAVAGIQLVAPSRVSPFVPFIAWGVGVATVAYTMLRGRLRLRSARRLLQSATAEVPQ